MLTASQANSKALAAIAHKQSLIRDSLQDLPAAMRNALDYVESEISERAADGQGEVVIPLISIFRSEFGRPELSALANILKAFGYRVEYSFLSDMRNEKIFVMWNT